jgi:hypothetical protein
MQVIEAQRSWSWRLTITLHIKQKRTFAVQSPGMCLASSAGESPGTGSCRVLAGREWGSG